MSLKYELVDTIRKHCGKPLYQILALKDFANVKAGDRGGYVSNSDNLSQHGDCWVYNNAFMLDNSRIYGNASLHGSSRMYGHSSLHDDSILFGNSTIFNHARMHHKSVMFNAVIKISPVFLSDFWNITISHEQITIDCQHHKADTWFNFSDSEIENMHVAALKWWKVWKPVIQAIHANHINKIQTLGIYL